MKTLLLKAYHTNQMSYYDDWIDAFEKHQEFDCTVINVLDEVRGNQNLKKKIASYPCVILHHSMTGDSLYPIEPYISALQNRSGKLVTFVGNEVNLLTIGMAPKIALFKRIMPDIIATQLLEETGVWLYHDCVTRVISLPHALNPEKFKKTRDIRDRAIDVGTRSARYPKCLGDNDRNSLMDYFQQNEHGLKVDLGLSIGDKLRFSRSEWSDFLNRCKSTLSTEAGSYYLERDDATINEIKHYLQSCSGKVAMSSETTVRRLLRRLLPYQIRQLITQIMQKHIVKLEALEADCEFDDIYEMFFAAKSVAPFYSKAISSRHFDAIGTHTLHVMYPGRYNDILKPGEHYFELHKDHSNLDDLIILLGQPKKLSAITSAVYDHVLMHHTHQSRLDYLYEVLTT